MYVNERSSKIVISTGVMRPGIEAEVEALNALQNSMMLTPCWPRAGPTGGAGLACPAGIWSFTIVMTFLAMSHFLPWSGARGAGSHRRRAGTRRG